MHWFWEKNETLDGLTKTLALLENGDPATLAKLAALDGVAVSGMTPAQRQAFVIAQVKASIDFAKHEPHTEGDVYHSRDPLAGLVQSWLGDPGDTVVPGLQAFGQDNPIVWIPTGIDGILEHFRQKAPFQQATAKSSMVLPPSCKVALVSDWGADNEHARRLGGLAVAHGANYLIHLGDIYYSGTEGECASFIERWPLRDAEDKPRQGYSFSLNGNHEMYSQGRAYFSVVLPALGQEASYFTLSNDWWNIHGLDTAYVPFSLSGGDQDANVRSQWEWLLARIEANPKKKNILLTHHQPVSAHLPELAASRALESEWEKLTSLTSTEVVFAWFFGHEHRCVLYDDTKTYFKARLIGNGAIPHLPETEDAAQAVPDGATCTPLWKVNHGTIGPQVAISTLAMLTFDHDRCTAEYINEDGSLFYAEELSGGPNCEVAATTGAAPTPGPR
jgi:predicted phosphodiesterase